VAQVLFCEMNTEVAELVYRWTLACKFGFVIIGVSLKYLFEFLSDKVVNTFKA
jgi:hypothetical protein